MNLRVSSHEILPFFIVAAKDVRDLVCLYKENSVAQSLKTSRSMVPSKQFSPVSEAHVVKEPPSQRALHSVKAQTSDMSFHKARYRGHGRDHSKMNGCQTDAEALLEKNQQKNYVKNIDERCFPPSQLPDLAEASAPLLEKKGVSEAPSLHQCARNGCIQHNGEIEPSRVIYVYERNRDGGKGTEKEHSAKYEGFGNPSPTQSANTERASCYSGLNCVRGCPGEGEEARPDASDSAVVKDRRKKCNASVNELCRDGIISRQGDLKEFRPPNAMHVESVTIAKDSLCKAQIQNESVVEDVKEADIGRDTYRGHFSGVGASKQCSEFTCFQDTPPSGHFCQSSSRCQEDIKRGASETHEDSRVRLKEREARETLPVDQLRPSDSTRTVEKSTKENGEAVKRCDDDSFKRDFCNEATCLQSCDGNCKVQNANVPEVQQKGSCCVNVGDISIRFGENDNGKSPEESGCGQEMEEIRGIFQEILKRFPVDDKNIENSSQVNVKLLGELKSACLEAYELEGLVQQWKSKYEEVEDQLKQAKGAENEKEFEKNSLLAERNEFKAALSLANQDNGRIKEELIEKAEEMGLRKERIAFLEGLLKEKQKAMEELVSLQECEVEENFELTDMETNLGKIGGEKGVSHTSSVLSCLLSPLKTKKYIQAGRLSKKKRMRLIIDDLDEEICELRKGLSAEKKKVNILKLLKEGGDREVEDCKKKTAADARAMQKMKERLETVDKKLLIQNKEKEEFMQTFTAERNCLNRRNEECIKELGDLREEHKQMAWQLRFEKSYNEKMEERIQSYLGFFQQKKDAEERKLEETVKAFSSKFEEKNNQLRSVNLELSAERKAKKVLAEKFKEMEGKLCNNSMSRELNASKQRDSYLPQISRLIEGVTGDFLKVCREYKCGNTDNVALMNTLGKLGGQVSDFICRQQEVSEAKESTKQMIKVNNSKEFKEIQREKRAIEKKLSLSLSKLEKLKERISDLEEKYSESIKENLVLKYRNADVKSENECAMAQLMEENEILALRLGGIAAQGKNVNVERQVADLEVENAKLKSSLKDTMRLLESARNENRSLEKRVPEIMEGKEGLIEKRKTLTEERELEKNEKKEKDEMDAIAKENGMLKKRAEDATREIGDLTARCEELDAKLNECQKLDTAAANGFAFEQTIHRLEKEVDAKDTAILALKSDAMVDKENNDVALQTIEVNHSKEREKLRHEIHDLHEKNTKLNARIAQVLDEKEEADEMLSEKEGEIKKLLLEKEELCSELERSSLELNATIQEFNNLLMKNEHLMLKEKECREMHSNSSNVGDLDSKLAEMKAENIELVEEIESLKEQLREECSENNEVLVYKESLLEQKSEEIEDMKEKLEEIARTNKDVKEKFEDLQGKWKVVSARRDVLEKQLHSANVERDKFRSQCADYRTRWEKREEKLEELNNETAALEKEKRQLDIQVGQYKESVESMNKKLELRNKKSQEREAAVERTITAHENDVLQLEEKIAILEDENSTLRSGVRMMLLEKDPAM